MKKVILLVLAFSPSLAFAQGVGNLTNIETFIRSIGRITQIALPIVVGLALLAFFWGLARFVFQSGKEDAQKEAKNMMLWSIVALFVMVSVWGLVNFIGTTLGVGAGTGNNGAPTIPTVPGL